MNETSLPPSAEHEVRTAAEWPGALSAATEEMGAALMPALVVGVLAASPAALGVIEAVALAITSVARLVAGIAVRPSRRRVRASAQGMAGVAACTGALSLVAAPWQAGVARVGVTAARALDDPAGLADLAATHRPEVLGRAYGAERAGDHLGAAIGALAAGALVAALGVRTALALALVPGLVAAWFAWRRRSPAERESERVPLRQAAVMVWRGRLRSALVGMVLLEAANIAFVLLILRATAVLGKTMDANDAVVAGLLLYVIYRLVAVVSAILGGRLADRVGGLPVLVGGALLLLAGYVEFALVPAGSIGGLTLAFMAAGAGIGLAETAEHTAIGRLAERSALTTAFGVLQTIQYGGRALASLVAGLLWTLVSPAAGMLFAIPMIVASVLVLSAGARRWRAV